MTREQIMRILHPLLLAGAALLAGCTVGPDFRQPVVAGANGQWIGPAAPGAVDALWWQSLGDPVLAGLVESAIRGNADIRSAEARLREARANRDTAAGGRLPSVNAKAGFTQTQLSKNGQFPIESIPGFNRQFGLFDAGFDAAWEIDLWGSNRRTVEAAGRRTESAAAGLAAMRLQIIAEVGRSYADLRATQARLQGLDADAGYRAVLASLARQRADAGEASAIEANAANARAADARALIAGARADQSAAIYRLALLCGQPPDALANSLSTAAPIPEAPPIVAAGLRSDLLTRRPDVRAAQADLAAATADIGVATAELFPKLTLVGSLGQQSQSLSDIGIGGSTRFGIGPSFSWPIFAAGRIRAQIRGADARADAAGAAYEKAVLTALSDSETALNRYAATGTALAEREAALDAAQRSAGLAQKRFASGEDDRLAVLEAQSTATAAGLLAIAARADHLTAYVSLTKALGGGWNDAPTPEN
jgi:NodT family efflux transporter outer membrane factor (OMF) lipoprotein